MSYRDRVRDERDDLRDKVMKLEAFMLGDSFSDIDDSQRILLFQQHRHMDSYLFTLESRIERFEERRDE